MDPINLLLIEGEEKFHYAWIKSYDRLLSYTSHHPKVFCPHCCYGFTKSRNGIENLRKHEVVCEAYGPQRTEIPKDTWIKFKEVTKMQKLPFAIYADFETINVKITSCEPERNSYTVKKTHHEVSGFNYVVVSPYFPTKRETYRGADAGKVFLERIIKEERRILKPMEDNKDMVMHPEGHTDFSESTLCHICEEAFVDIKDGLQIPSLKGDKVRDHCHFTGRYRGAAHNGCNLLYRKIKDIPVFFHNLGGYDGHIIFQNLCKIDSIKEPEVVAKTIEKFVTFSIGNLKFKDSLQFLNSSLDKLVKNLAAKVNVFKNLREYFEEKWGHLPEEAFTLLTRKGVYPYAYMDSFERFEETSLPPREEYYNDLGKSHITDDEYEFAKKVWNTFQLKNMGELHDLYMETDVVLLADIFENFRDFSLSNYRLDPAHFTTAPGLSWTAALKYTGVNLEIPTDPDMHMFFDRGLTGGISIVADHYAKANNPDVDGYDPQQPKTYIKLVDCNNQYGHAMRQFLPTHGFEWVVLETESPDFWTEFVLNQQDEQEDGYIFEVDLEYPTHLHDAHDNFPLAPVHLDIQKNMLSSYQKELADDLGVKVGGEKLCLTLDDKKNYICHYRNLKLYLQRGLRLQKLRKILRFKQSAWLKPYIDLNTQLRQGASSKFEENLFKLMNNSFFGKTCEDVRKYKDVKVALKEKRVRKLIARPTVKQWKIYEENLAAVQLKRATVELNKPRYIGMCILDISKIVMYRFHYDYMMEKYPGTKLLFTDTDSFCYNIPTESNIYDDIKDSDWFDFSNYPTDHPNFSTKNKLIPGKFKDEMGGKPTEEFVGLRSKMYSIKTKDWCKKTGKGILTVVKDKEISHQNYKDTLFGKKQMRHKMTKIMNKEHEMFTADIVKTTLSPFNDKKWISRIGDTFTSYSFGHHRIQEEELVDCLTDLINVQ